MSVIGARKRIHQFMMQCNGVTEGTYRFGGIEYKLGKREIGHIHGNHLVDIPFPKKIRNEIIEKEEAETSSCIAGKRMGKHLSQQ